MGELIIVIIPTKNRPNELKRALTCVSKQTKKPDKIIVVNDCDKEHYQKVEDIINSFKNTTSIKNTRTKNYSGCENSALMYLLEQGIKPEKTFLAFLDDDDLWEENYLEICYDAAKYNKSDWIITGLIRYFTDFKKKSYVYFPNTKDYRIAFIRNPGIQSSNLFIRFSKFLEAGSFDEFIDSTTDCDIFIRLCMLKSIKYEIITEYLVHHDASMNRKRMSNKGSRLKIKGLNEFYWKYSQLMNKIEKEKFSSLCSSIFDCKLDSKIIRDTIIENNLNPNELYFLRLNLVDLLFNTLKIEDRYDKDIQEKLLKNRKQGGFRYLELPCFKEKIDIEVPENIKINSPEDITHIYRIKGLIDSITDKRLEPQLNKIKSFLD